MAQAFSFAFEDSDIEESENEILEVGPSHDTLENKYVTVTDPRTQPRLHKLQDLVCKDVLSLPYFSQMYYCLLFRHPNVPSTAAQSCEKRDTNRRYLLRYRQNHAV